MRDVTLIMTASIDGYVDAPAGHAGGLPEPQELQSWKLDRIRNASTHIMGRVTYEQMASVWPTATGEYAAPMNEIPKVVFSKTLTQAEWPDSTIASGDLADEIAGLRNEPGGEIIAWGGATFVQALSRCQLINKYIIITQPVAFGAGAPMFADLPDALHLHLVASTTYASGTTLSVFEPRGWGRDLEGRSG
ncbi:MAG: bifunctional deaminase-reductase domain protein [Acidimicrobiales bacterium]|nr:bifunctional deaminase-reductase domain protein [Acidimicrobiales bacterium]